MKGYFLDVFIICIFLVCTFVKQNKQFILLKKIFQ